MLPKAIFTNAMGGGYHKRYPFATSTAELHHAVKPLEPSFPAGTRQGLNFIRNQPTINNGFLSEAGGCSRNDPLPAIEPGAEKMLKILIGLILILLLFIVLFFNKLKEALSAGGMAVLLAIVVGLSGAAAWMGFADKGKTDTAAVRAGKAALPVAEVPVQTMVIPGDGIPDASSRRAKAGENVLSVHEIYERVSPSVVVIYNLNESGQVRGHGTGFFIDPWGMVATNYHVVEGASSLKIRTKSGATMDIRGIAASDPENDVVILSAVLPIDSIRTLTMTSSLPQVGDKIVVIGTP
jgi:hypothetical protein